MIGEVFGKLTVISFGGVIKGYKIWHCRCECGRTTNSRGTSLNYGTSKSCGICNHEIHGKSKTKEFRTWSAIISRCHLPTNKAYKNYGGRGIIVCDRWRYSFTDFFTDMGLAPSPQHSLDRINNDGNYEPGNCRWATIKQQSNNRRKNLLITYLGETKTLATWCDHFNLSWPTVRTRLKMNWSIHDCFNKPIAVNKRLKTHPSRSFSDMAKVTP